MADEQTPDATALPAGLSQDQINQLLTSLHLGQGLPDVQPDRTPVDSSGFGGGLRRVVSLLGEFAGSPGPETFKALSPREREEAGIQALSRFGTGLLQASGSGKWIGSNLGDAFARAERGYDQTTRQAIGSLAARQSYAAQGEQANLDRLRAALPLLALKQKQDAINALPATLSGSAAAPSTNIAAGGSINVPPEYLPYYAEASARTGIPVEVLIAQGKQEGNFDPTATGKAGEIGIHQILPATAKSPGFGMTGVDPATLRDPRANINFAADYLKARGGPRTDFSNPATVAAALKGYNGGGDPNYVANVMRYVPGARSSLAPPPGQATAPTPTPSGARSTLPPPEAPIMPGAGTARTAGPAAPTGSIIPPSPPGSAAAVAAIREGMTGAGADPVTLAPGPGSAPAPHPDSYEAYKLQHPITLSDEHRGLFNQGPDPDQIRGIAERKRNAERLFQEGRTELDTAKMAKAHELLDKATGDENTLRENARKLGVDKQADYYKEQEKQRHDAWTAERTEAREQAKARQKLQDDMTLETTRAEEARKTAAAGSENSYVLDERKRFGLERDAARTNIDDLSMLKALSDASGTSTPLDNIRVGDRTGRDLMANMGLGTEAQNKKWGAQQAFEAAVNKTVTGLRQGISMGQLSDRDMIFIQHMAPNLLQNPQTRNDIIAYLEQAQYRKLQYSDAVEQLWDGGKGMSWGQAKREAQKQQPDYVPKVPDEYSKWDVPSRKLWLSVNARPGQLMRGPDGRLSIYQPQPEPGAQ